MTCRSAIVLAIIAVSAVFGQESDRKFNVSGFMDFQVEKAFFSDNSMYNFIGLTNDLSFKQGKLNLYFDFKPNENQRALTEIRFLTQPNGSGAWPAQKITMVGIDTVNDTARPGTNTRVVDNDGSFLNWGGIAIERAQYDIMVNQYVNCRVGKFLTPAGIWNVDHGSPVILTVFAPYQTSYYPIFPKSQLGLMEYGNAFFGDINLDYSLYLSTGRDQNTIAGLKQVGVGGHAGAEFQVLDGLNTGVSLFTGDQIRKVDATEILINPMKPGFTTIGDAFANPDNRTFRDSVAYESREICAGMDLKQKCRGFTLQGEFNYQHLSNSLRDTGNVTTVWGAYLLLSYKLRLSSKLSVTPYAMVERIQSDSATNNPQNWFAGNTSTGGQTMDGFTSMLGGVNINLYTNTFIKVEYSIVDAHMVSYYEPYQDAFDRSAFNIQLAVAF